MATMMKIYEAITLVLGPSGTFMACVVAVYLVCGYIAEEWRWKWRWHVRAWLGIYDDYE